MLRTKRGFIKVLEFLSFLAQHLNFIYFYQFIINMDRKTFICGLLSLVADGVFASDETEYLTVLEKSPSKHKLVPYLRKLINSKQIPTIQSNLKLSNGNVLDAEFRYIIEGDTIIVSYEDREDGYKDNICIGDNVYGIAGITFGRNSVLKQSLDRTVKGLWRWYEKHGNDSLIMYGDSSIISSLDGLSGYDQSLLELSTVSVRYCMHQYFHSDGFKRLAEDIIAKH